MSISSRATVSPWRSTTPPARTCSAVLTTMSMRAPFCSACSVTDSVSVTSSGTISTRSIRRNASKPGNGFQGSASPTNTIDAPASENAFAIAWPTAVRPSVISTRRNFGSQVISRRCGSSAMFSVSFPGSAIATAEPLRSSLNSSRTRCAFDRVAMQMRDHDRAGVELHGADPPRRAFAEIGIGRGLHRRLGDQRAAAIDIAERQPRRQAGRAGIARRIDHGAAIEADLQARSGPSAAAAVRPCAVRLRTPCGRSGSRVRLQRVLALGAGERFGHAALASTAAQDDRPRS